MPTVSELLFVQVALASTVTDPLPAATPPIAL
jgi:hypothetical protein